MPHKRNPILSERLAGLARILRGNLLAGLEDVALWHERDISHSSVERMILPDSCGLAYYVLRKASGLVRNLDVFLASLQKYAPRARVIVLVEKNQRQYVEGLRARFPLHAILVQPVSERDMAAVLDA